MGPWSKSKESSSSAMILEFFTSEDSEQFDSSPKKTPWELPPNPPSKVIMDYFANFSSKLFPSYLNKQKNEKNCFVALIVNLQI